MCRSYADSKTLTDEKREQLFGEMEVARDIAFAVDRVTAAEISSQMLRRYVSYACFRGWHHHQEPD